MYFLMYYSNPLSSNTASMQSFQVMKLELPSNAYSSLNPLKVIFLATKISFYTELQIWFSW